MRVLLHSLIIHKKQQFFWAPEIDFLYETKARKVIIDFKFDALYREYPEVGIVKKVCTSGWNSTCQLSLTHRQYVGRSVCLLCLKCVGRIKWPSRMLKVISGRLRLTCATRKRLKQGDENGLERNLRLQKVVANKQHRWAGEIKEERRARLENDGATKLLRLTKQMDEEKKARLEKMVATAEMFTKW